MYLIVYSLKQDNWDISDNPDAITDHWEAEEIEEKANQRYEEILELNNLYSASLCKPIRSTDYPIR